jgi:hypothetical protein
MTSKYAGDIDQLKQDVAVIKALAEARKETTNHWRGQIDKKLDSLIANGKSYTTTDMLTKAIEAHTASCPSRKSGLLESAKENWKTTAAALTVLAVSVTIIEKLVTMLWELISRVPPTALLP